MVAMTFCTSVCFSLPEPAIKRRKKVNQKKVERTVFLLFEYAKAPCHPGRGHSIPRLRVNLISAFYESKAPRPFGPWHWYVHIILLWHVHGDAEPLCTPTWWAWNLDLNTSLFSLGWMSIAMGFTKQSLTTVWFFLDLLPKWYGVRHRPEAFLGWFNAGWVERGSELVLIVIKGLVCETLYTWPWILLMTSMILCILQMRKLRPGRVKYAPTTPQVVCSITLCLVFQSRFKFRAEEL